MSPLFNLSGRERALLFFALPVALLFTGYRFGWQPLDAMRASREGEIAAYRLVAQSAALAGAQPLARREEAETVPLAARVTQSAEAAGLSLRRIEPEGDRIRVLVEDAGYAQVVLWIAELEAERQVTLAAVELDRRIAPGTVSARLLLEGVP